MAMQDCCHIKLTQSQRSTICLRRFKGLDTLIIKSSWSTKEIREAFYLVSSSSEAGIKVHFKMTWQFWKLKTLLLGHFNRIPSTSTIIVSMIKTAIMRYCSARTSMEYICRGKTLIIMLKTWSKVPPRWIVTAKNASTKKTVDSLEILGMSRFQLLSIWLIPIKPVFHWKRNLENIWWIWVIIAKFLL